MNILFLHQNFPGQFKQLAPALVKAGHQVTALRLGDQPSANWQGVQVHSYRLARGNAANVHPWLLDLESKTIRAEAVFHKALALKAAGYSPDVVIAHPGWGESLFIKDVWPKAKLGLYCEYFYNAAGGDVGFDPELKSQDPADVCRLRIKNANNLLHFQIADAGIAPTQWQASTFPELFRSHITVIHDGINTQIVKPRSDVRLTLNDQIVLSRQDEVVTFVNRNLEPYRGYHSFMRCLPALMKQRPKARILIVGGNDVSYGARPSDSSQTWRQIFLDEVKDQLDLSRIHFLGNIGYANFLALLQVSTVHVYLTYPFVLSWSLLEAMSCGCAIVGSDTAPVREVIVDKVTGRLVDFFDTTALAAQIDELLSDPMQRAQLGKAARCYVEDNFDLNKVCLPAQIRWVDSLVG